MRLLALLLAMPPVGHSVDGRTIRPVVLGGPAAGAHRVLVVGCIHVWVHAIRELALEGYRR